MEKIILSILIPTVEERCEKFTKLLNALNTQNVFDGVEIVSICDNKEISIGAKRQNLLEIANGEFIVFIDDDDHVSDSYIAKILFALKRNPDTVGFKISCSFDGSPEVIANASMRYQEWETDKDGFAYVRTPYQKTPIRKSIALQIGYKDMRYGEDHDYSIRLKESGLMKKEVYLPEVLYFYTYTYEEKNKKYGIKDQRSDRID